MFPNFEVGLLLLLICFLVTYSEELSTKTSENSNVKELAEKVHSITFLVTVNDTWDENGCVQTVKTPALSPNKKSQSIMVGNCDHGPLEFTIQGPADRYSSMSVFLTFHSSVIVDASPPTCSINWNGTYLVPPKAYTKELPSVLPGCFTQDSREGYHMTSYWFYLLDWIIV